MSRRDPLFCHRSSDSLARRNKIFFLRAEDARMPVGLSSAGVARLAAGVLSALWAMTALANEYVTLAAVGPSFSLIVAIATHVFLIAGASLAFVNAQGWRRVLLIALGVVTIDHLVNAIGSGAAIAQVASSLVAFGAIFSLVALSSRGR
jgi:hypothetical protein